MSINDESTVTILHDHYADTCQYVRKLIGVRDRLFLAVLVLLGFQFFQISDPDQSSLAIVNSLNNYIGSNISLNKDVLSTILWFALLSFVIRYFQVNVFINRQHDYLHKLEEKFTELFGEKIITREGEGYLSEYPIFSNWTHLLYTWIFPMLLILVGGFKVYSDCPGYKNIEITYLLSCLFFLMIAISTTLYMLSLHAKKKE